MSQADPASLIERCIAAVNDGDYDGLLALVHEDVVHDLRDGSREIGRENLRLRFAQARSHLRESWADAVVMASADGRHGAAEITLRGTYVETLDDMPPAGGQNYSLPAGVFFEIDGAAITRITLYVNEKAWAASLNAR